MSDKPDKADKPPEPLPRDPFWPEAVIVLGLSLTAAWMILIGYAVVKLIDLAV